MELFLHACCAPCAAGALYRLNTDLKETAEYDLTLYFYNPNIFDDKEYYKRAAELFKLTDMFDIKNIVIEPYDYAEFLNVIKGFENEKEGGKRCEPCIDLRLNKTANKAIEFNIPNFASTLSVSPHKNLALINTLGDAAAKKISAEKLNRQSVKEITSLNFIPFDFKKKDGFKKSVQICESLNIYRQSYCGCEYSICLSK